MWGRDILVAPVVEKGATSRRVYLPQGTWFDYWTNERVTGGREITRSVDLETMPLYVRAGAIIPFGPVKQYVDEPVDEPIAVTVYPGANGAGSLYEDDGKTFDYRKGAWSRVVFNCNPEASTIIISPDPRGQRPRTPKTFVVRVAGRQGQQTVRYDGTTLAVRL